MGAAHGRRRVDELVLGAGSPLHEVPAAPKLAGLVAFVVVVAATPRWAVPALVLDALVVAVLVAVARIPPLLVARRLLALVPFVAFAVLLPFIGTGERTEVLGLEVSVDGLWAAWNIVAKAVVGAGAAIVVTATTPIPELVRGLRQLRVPAPVVAIVASMLRYLDLVADQLARARVAMASRGHDPRWLWQVRPLASSVGTVFVRSYERGERVHLAMAARGFSGTVPETRTVPPARPGQIVGAALPAAVALVAAVVAVAP
jgi:cobalt/nickel transport system permease protein